MLGTHSPGRAEALTSRELEVLRLLVQGLTRRQMAHQLGISDRTVSNHLDHARQKLHAGSERQAVTIALQKGLVRIHDQEPLAEVGPPYPCGFRVASHKFVPVRLGKEAGGLSDSSLTSLLWDWLPCTVLPARELPSATLYVLPFGVTVIHLKEVTSFKSLGALAIWRAASYDEVLSRIRALSSADLIGAIDGATRKECAPSYVLSVFFLLESAWENPQRLRSALEIMSTPSVLLPPSGEPDSTWKAADALERALRAEEELLARGFSDPKIVPFGIGTTSMGYASWSGVSYYPLVEDLALSEQHFVELEVLIQGVWCYCYEIIKAGNEGRDLDEFLEFGSGYLRSYASRLSIAQPQETAQVCLMREAIVKTSRVTQMVRDASEILDSASLKRLEQPR